jgi:hypothetical protein
MRLLLNAGADVHHAYVSGATPLHSVCEFQEGDVRDGLRLLLAAGARPDVVDAKDKSPLDRVGAAEPREGGGGGWGRACGLRTRLPLRAQIAPLDHELRAVLLAALPWGRRQPVAVACYDELWC